MKEVVKLFFILLTLTSAISGYTMHEPTPITIKEGETTRNFLITDELTVGEILYDYSSQENGYSSLHVISYHWFTLYLFPYVSEALSSDTKIMDVIKKHNSYNFKIITNEKDLAIRRERVIIGLAQGLSEEELITAQNILNYALKDGKERWDAIKVVRKQYPETSFKFFWGVLSISSEKSFCASSDFMAIASGNSGLMPPWNSQR